MDFDQDGILDILSGSYDPGDLYLIRGLGQGQYAKIEKILDREGLAMVHHPEEFRQFEKLKADEQDVNSEEATQLRVASFGSWPATVDWENDGDLDLLIGSFRGQLHLRLNEGTRQAPSFSGDSPLVHADGKPLQLHGHAAPAVGDWDGDGLWDLVLGSDTGCVGWCRNQGTASQPEFGPFQELLPAAAKDKFLSQELESGQEPKIGVRTQICLVDYNQDGLLDLLVGDYSEIKIKRNLTDEQKSEQQALIDQQAELAKQIQDLGYAEEVQEQRQKLVEQLFAMDDKMKTFYEDVRTSSYLWLFLRNKTAPENQDSKQGPSRSDTDNGSEGEAPVTFQAWAEPLDSATPDTQRYRVSVQFEIEAGWHLYDESSPTKPTQVLEVELEPAQQVKPIGSWSRPRGIPDINHRGARLYVEQVTLTREIEVTGKASRPELKAVARFQVCNEQFCRPTVTQSRTIQWKGPESD